MLRKVNAHGKVFRESSFSDLVKTLKKAGKKSVFSEK